MEDTQDLSLAVTNLQRVVQRWEQQLASDAEPTAAFRQAMAEFGSALHGVGQAGFARFTRACEIDDEVLVRSGLLYRFKQDVDKEWLTPWGKVVVPRRLYQPDRGGPSCVPLDERCGMVGRFMVPELERITAFLGARLVPSEVEQSLREVLPEAPSCTAIQHVLRRVGQCAEDHADQLELALQATAPLNVDGDTLVVSWDGVTVPLREAACKRGRPAERPTGSEGDTSPTAWKEASVGMVATYQTPLEPQTEDPVRVDVRYSARMPEAKMVTLIDGLVAQAVEAKQRGSFQHLVVLADGKREIWRVVDEQPVFDGFTRILDFYHATEHVSKAAEQLFGKSSAPADHWYRTWRHKLRHEAGAIDGLIRSIAYHRRKLRLGSDHHKAATRELGYFRNNRDKMDYAGYRALGLIISSGPVEAAAKTLVGHRLKRSGMRWSRDGGQQILNLRVHVQSGRWDPMWTWYQDRTTMPHAHRSAA